MRESTDPNVTETFEEMKAYVRFDGGDQALLREVWPRIAHHAPDVSRVFYERIEAFEGARTVFEDEAQVLRLKQTLQVWLEELFNGPWDDAYARRRRRIGSMHVEVGLPHRYMFTAMQGVQEHLCVLATRVCESAHETAQAIRRVCTLDLALMTNTYMGEREQQGLETFASLLVGHLPSAAFVVDDQGVVASSTKAAADLCRGTPDGRGLVEVLPPELARESGLTAWLQSRPSTRVDLDVPRLDVLVDDQLRSFRVGAVTTGHPGLPSLVRVEDITDSLAGEARARRQEALARLGQMSATVAHELRNPLAGISGAIQVLAGTMPSEDPRSTIMGKVHEQVGRLDRIVRDLLQFARTPETRPSRVEVHHVADAVLEEVSQTLPSRDLALSRVGEGVALADEAILHRILLNLVQNAIHAITDRDREDARAGTPGQIEIRIDGRTVSVCDNGPGVPPEVSGRIFEPFFTTRTMGTGLGLPNCQNAADAMGASLRLGVGHGLGGATFRLQLAEDDPV